MNGALDFDFDGLILDTETPEMRIWQRLFAQAGGEFDVKKAIKPSLGRMARKSTTRGGACPLRSTMEPRPTSYGHWYKQRASK